MDEKGVWRLSPFYDFTFAHGPNGWQPLSVAGEGEHPGAADLLRLADDVSCAARMPSRFSTASGPSVTSGAGGCGSYVDSPD